MMPITAFAYRERTDTTKWVVSFWYIPHDYRYDIAKPMCAFFDSKEEAASFCKEYEAPPEMAFMMPIEEFDRVMSKHPSKLKWQEDLLEEPSWNWD